MNNNVMKLSHQCDTAYKQFLWSKSTQATKKYKTLRNVVTDAVQKSKRNYFIQGARYGTKHFWANIKQCSSLGRIKKFHSMAVSF